MRTTVKFETNSGVEFTLGKATVREEVSGAYAMRLEATARSSTVSLDRLLGRSVTLSVALPRSQTRHFNGIVSRAEHAWGDGTRGVYTLLAESRLAGLRLSRDSRIFQELSVPDIVERVAEAGAVPIELRLRRSYDPLPMVIQYRESDADFLHRLLAEAGIGYYFRHDRDSHTMVLFDDARGFATLSGFTKLAFAPNSDREGVRSWTAGAELRPERVVVDDHQPFGSGASLRGAAGSSTAAVPREEYVFPAGLGEPSDAPQRAAQIRDALRCGRRGASGVASTRGLAVGHWFRLTDHPRATDTQLVPLIATHSFVVAPSVPEVGPGRRRSFVAEVTSSFVAAPMSESARCLPAYAPVDLGGPHTATVVGPAGESIHCDEHGRVKVHFHWDREPGRNEHSSAWVRLSSLWAGPDRAGYAIPHVGDEVVVEFEHGDPRRPIVTGALWTSDNAPPVALPEDKAVTGLFTAGPDGSRQHLRFDDHLGAQQLSIVASRDFSRLVGNDEETGVGGDQSSTIGGSRTDDVGDNWTVDVGKDLTIDVDHDARVDVDRDLTVEVDRNVLVDVGGSLTLTTGNAKIEMKANGDVTIEGKKIVIKGNTVDLKEQP